MKREGRQHGMVRSSRILPSPCNQSSNFRFINKLDSLPAAGIFTKVPSKPTNHSKFTGKCGTQRCMECHTHPACKSKEKAKGTQKLRSCDVATIYNGISATGILGHLDNDQWDGEVEDDEDSPYIHYGLAPESGCLKEDDETDQSGRSSMSFSELGFVWDQVEDDEDWCLVGVI